MTQTKESYIQLSDEKRAQIRLAQAQVKEELPELAKRLDMASKAAEENTFSGELRRAIHASGFPLNFVADRTGTTPIILDEFLTGEGSLQSDVIDRLVALIGYKLVTSQKLQDQKPPMP